MLATTSSFYTLHSSMVLLEMISIITTGQKNTIRPVFNGRAIWDNENQIYKISIGYYFVVNASLVLYFWEKNTPI